MSTYSRYLIDITGCIMTYNIAEEKLTVFISQIEALLLTKTEITDQISAILADAKAQGFDVPIMRKIVALRKKEAAKREQEDILLVLYQKALGML